MNPFVRAIPPSLVRFFAKPYVAGDSLAVALDQADAMWRKDGLLATLDLLAEQIETPEQVAENVATYEQMIDAVATDARLAGAAQPTLSLKLSSFTAAPLDRGGDAAGSREAASRLIERAEGKNVSVTVDMESSAWTDFTLDAVTELHARGHRRVGAVIQSRLNRTEQDLERLPAGCRVRLVIGIYSESRDIALTAKPAMKEKLLVLARALLDRGHYVEFATHDVACLKRFVDEVVPAANVGPERFELQMLFGVPRADFHAEMRARGIKTRLYLPFARSWPQAIAYLRRRLDEYPTMSLLVLRDRAGDLWSRAFGGAK